MLDLIIRGGTIADGSGAPMYRADVGVLGDKIAEVGQLDGVESVSSVDAKGHIVAPGFVDVHTHSDITLLVDPRAESAVRQGVTTQVFPNCGMGLAPAVGPALVDVEKQVQRFGIDVTWRTVGEYYERLAAKQPSVNVVPMVAQGTVRMAVMGFSEKAPTTDELNAMKAHVDEAMQSGARGMCSGLRYVPSGYASEDELIELASVVGRYGGIYASHIRSEGDNGEWFDALREAIAIGRGSGVPVQISHLKAVGSDVWGKSSEALALIRNARDDGVDVMCDQYPYEATSSTLFVLFPQWSQEGGIEAFLARSVSPDDGPSMKAGFLKALALRGGGTRMTVTEYGPDPSIAGNTLAQAAETLSLGEFDAAVHLLSHSNGKVSMVFHTLERADVERIFVDPLVMVASDGSAVAPHGKLASDYYPHPRNYGCFPKVLGDFVRQRGLVSMEDAVKKMTSTPASRFKLEKRGQIATGWFADLVVFDPDTVADNATFEEPRRFPDGIHHVTVNGQLVVKNGSHTGATPGNILYSEAKQPA
jgi:N-acyl-D-amino-acid deacylase